MLHNRLSQPLSGKLRERQHGFRPGRSTSELLHILLRVQEPHERSDSPLWYVFADWKQAFDRLAAHGLLTALQRPGLPEDNLAVIEDTYSRATFEVREAGLTPTVRKQKYGIRQGCSLSPFLFICFMTAPMHDVEEDYRSEYHHIPTVNDRRDPVFDLGYTDDAVLMAHQPGIQRSS